MIACVTTLYLAAVEGRADAALRAQPLVIDGQPWELRPTYAYSRDGGRTADGRSLPARYAVDLESLPPADGVSLGQAMGRAVRDETRLSAAIGLAPHRFTAQVAAALTRPNHLRVIEPAAKLAFLAGQSLQFLPFDRGSVRRFNLLGIRTLGQFAALPLPELQAQFGPAIADLYRLARGEADLPWSPDPPPRRLTARRLFDDPLVDAAALTAVCKQLAAKLEEQLAADGLAGRMLELTWETADPAHLAATLVEWLLTAPFTAGLSALTVMLSDLTAELSLFDEETRDARSRTLDTLVARYGDIFYRPVPTAARRHPLVERRFTLHSLDGPPLA